MIVEIWEAMIAGINTGFSDRGMNLGQCKIVGGNVSVGILEEAGAHLPAVLVSVLRQSNIRLSGRQGVAYDLDCAAFCIAAGQGDENADQRAARMAENMTGTENGILLASKGWGRADCRAIEPQTIDAINAWSGEAANQGLALWAVSWQQRVDTDLRRI